MPFVSQVPTSRATLPVRPVPTVPYRAAAVILYLPFRKNLIRLFDGSQPPADVIIIDMPVTAVSVSVELMVMGLAGAISWISGMDRPEILLQLVPSHRRIALSDAHTNRLL